MWCLCLVIASSLSSGAQAYALLQWMKFPTKRFVLVPRSFHGNVNHLASPQELMIWDASDDKFASEVPSYIVKPDSTIATAWGNIGWCLEAGSHKRRDVVRMSQCTDSVAQKWRLITDGHGRTMIQLKGTNECIDVSDNEGRLNGAPVRLRECDKLVTNSWRLEERMSLLTQRPLRSRLPSFSMRHVMISSLAMAGVISMFLGLWYGLLRRTEALNVDQHGGVSLTAPVLRRGSIIAGHGEYVESCNPIPKHHSSADISTLARSTTISMMSESEQIAPFRNVSAVPQTPKGVDADTFSVAPMMDFTDRHLRYLLRLLSRRATLYTEMITTSTLVHVENVNRFLAYNDPIEHPVVLQLGGSDVEHMKLAAAMAVSYGYDDINLNCGCPSDKVSGKGCFGLALMRDPWLVADLCLSISEATGKPATVKCRIGVDDDDSFEQLCAFVDIVSTYAGVGHFIIHARKGILGGLSPEENRRIPPLKYEFVYDLVGRFPHVKFTLNGGVETYDQIFEHLGHGAHGVMLGRAILSDPWNWSSVDNAIYGEKNPAQSRRQVLNEYAKYAEEEFARVKIEQPTYAPKVTRAILKHTFNLFHAEPRGRQFRRELETSLLMQDLSATEIVERASSVLLPETLDAPPREVLIPQEHRTRMATLGKHDDFELPQR